MFSGILYALIGLVFGIYFLSTENYIIKSIDLSENV
jgi:hypothetical protein